MNDSLAAQSGQQTVVLSGGCFWGIQLVFEHVKGVTKVTAGYSGGSAKNADYETVSTGIDRARRVREDRLRSVSSYIWTNPESVFLSSS